MLRRLAGSLTFLYRSSEAFRRTKERPNTVNSESTVYAQVA